MDIVERLRKHRRGAIGGPYLRQAADEIDRLRKRKDGKDAEIERLRRELAEARGLLREASEEWIDPHAYDRVLPEFADKCRAFMARIDAFLTADVSHSSQNGAGLSRTVDAEQSPLDRMADNARELGLDYTPADQPSEGVKP